MTPNRFWSTPESPNVNLVSRFESYNRNISLNQQNKPQNKTCTFSKNREKIHCFEGGGRLIWCRRTPPFAGCSLYDDTQWRLQKSSATFSAFLWWNMADTSTGTLHMVHCWVVLIFCMFTEEENRVSEILQSNYFLSQNHQLGTSSGPIRSKQMKPCWYFTSETKVFFHRAAADLDPHLAHIWLIQFYFFWIFMWFIL